MVRKYLSIVTGKFTFINCNFNVYVVIKNIDLDFLIPQKLPKLKRCKYFEAAYMVPQGDLLIVNTHM